MTVHNADVARIFNRLADLLEIEGANPFRVRAYRDAARTVGDLPHEVSALLAAGKDLSELHGIGKDLAGRIKEIVETGDLSLLEETERRVPEGLLEILSLGPLGPKRVKTLYDRLGIKSAHDLAAAAQAGKIHDRRGRRLPLLAAMLLRTFLYGGVIMAALLVVPWVYQGVAPSPFRSGIVTDLVFSIAATFLFVSLTSIAQLIGPNVLGSLLTGRYYHPREEQRIVLFLDLVGSTGIAEGIGNVGFHALLSETFTRLSRVVTDFGGEVYRYVGDALIATWPLGTPQENARPIRCLFACRDMLEAARSDLLRRHGHIPGFRASLHSGRLVAGEIGGFKREIALLGDAMNTAARLEQACRTTGHALLASKPLLDRTLMPAGIVVTSIGSHLLRGKSERLELFALERGTRGRADRHDSVARGLAERAAADASGFSRGSGGHAEAPNRLHRNMSPTS